MSQGNQIRPSTLLGATLGAIDSIPHRTFHLHSQHFCRIPICTPAYIKSPVHSLAGHLVVVVHVGHLCPRSGRLADPSCSIQLLHCSGKHRGRAGSSRRYSKSIAISVRVKSLPLQASRRALGSRRGRAPESPGSVCPFPGQVVAGTPSSCEHPCIATGASSLSSRRTDRRTFSGHRPNRLDAYIEEPRVPALGLDTTLCQQVAKRVSSKARHHFFWPPGA